MNINKNTPAGGAARGMYCNCLNTDTDTDCHCSDYPQQIQPPYMGRELRVSLEDYCKELNAFYDKDGIKITMSMIECCNLLLLESDRLERWRS